MSDEARNVELLRKAYDAWSKSQGTSTEQWLDICAEQIAFGSLANGPPGSAYLTAYQHRDEGLFRRARPRLGDDGVRGRPFRRAG